MKSPRPLFFFIYFFTALSANKQHHARGRKNPNIHRFSAIHTYAKSDFFQFNTAFWANKHWAEEMRKNKKPNVTEWNHKIKSKGEEKKRIFRKAKGNYIIKREVRIPFLPQFSLQTNSTMLIEEIPSCKPSKPRINDQIFIPFFPTLLTANKQTKRNQRKKNF